MRITIVGDPHCKPDNLDKINKLFDQVEELDNAVLWLGDFLDTKEVIRGKCLNTLYNRLKDSKLHHYILVGNHDWFNLECKEHSLEILKTLGNCDIIDEVFEQANFTAIPYMHDTAELKQILKKLPKDKPLFGHFEVIGFDFGNGYICERGLSVKDFAGFKQVISGHFHKNDKKDNFLYLGTPFSHSFGESNQTKMIAIYDIPSDEISYIKTNFPKHITLEIKNPKEVSSLKEYAGSSDYVRVINTCKDVSIDKSLHPKIKFIDRFNIKSEKQNFVINDAESNETKFQKWGKSVKKLPKPVLDLGLEILKSV